MTRQETHVTHAALDRLAALVAEENGSDVFEPMSMGRGSRFEESERENYRAAAKVVADAVLDPDEIPDQAIAALRHEMRDWAMNDRFDAELEAGLKAALVAMRERLGLTP